jgi:transposase
METIAMSVKEQQRAIVLLRWIEGEIGVHEAADLMGCSERTAWRALSAFRCAGPAGLVHANRGRASPRRLDGATRDRILALAAGRYAGTNDSHLTELLAEREGISVSRASLRCILRAAGLPSPRRRRPPRHRRRRERMPRAGLLLQLDGSRHDWLGGRGPWLTLVGAIDDATGQVTAARFRASEDAEGYLWVLRETIVRQGIPAAAYHDRAGIFRPTNRGRDGEFGLSQVGRAFLELGIVAIAALSPQAKGRIERLWGTFQDRLVAELRLAGVSDLERANAFLPAFLARHNARFAVAPLEPEGAWRALPPDVEVDRACCFKVIRRVSRDHTVSIVGTELQLPPGRGGRGYAGSDIEIHVRLDGHIVAWDGQRLLATAFAPVGPLALRQLGDVRPAPSLEGPARASLYRPPAAHPWRRPGRGVLRRLAAEGLTESPSS